MNITMKKFGYPATLVNEFDNWVVLLKPEQTTVGTLVLIEKSDAESLGAVRPESWQEFQQVCKFSENALNDSFSPEKFNYLALMMKDPNVHFHMVPRYNKTIMVLDEEFDDADWPGKTELNKIVMTDKQWQSIKLKIENAS